MDNVDLRELLQDCPTLYHVAACGSWSSIEIDGLLSTTALLDRYSVRGRARRNIESRRRPISVELKGEGFSGAVIRDQFPMTDSGLERCLTDNLSPSDWYRLLNGKVFFWLTYDRLLRLLNARGYRFHEHDVIELEAEPLVRAYSENIWLCPMNSGCTKPFAHPRGNDTFSRISDYPYGNWKAKRSPGERVVELAVDYAVPDVTKYVRKVRRMKGAKSLITLFES